MEENNIDKFFQQKLANQQVEPSDAVWDGIAHKMAISAKVTPFKSSKYLLLFLLLISVGISGYLWFEVNQLEVKVAQLGSEIERTNVDRTNVDSSGVENITSTTHLITQNLESESLNKKALKSSSLLNNKINTQNKNSSQSAQNESVDNEQEINAKQKIESKIELSNPTVIKGIGSSISKVNSDSRVSSISKAGKGEFAIMVDQNSDEVQSGEIEIRSKKNPFSDSLSSTLSNNGQSDYTTYIQSNKLQLTKIMSVNLTKTKISPSLISTDRDADYYTNKPVQFLIGGYGIVSQNYRRLKANAELIDYLNKAENTEVNYGGGLSLAYKLGNHWRIGLGFEFRERKQSATYPFKLQLEDAEFESSPGPSNGDLIWNYSQDVPSSLGITNIDMSENGFPFAGLNTSMPVNSYSTKLESERTQEIVRIPILLEYGISYANWNFLIGGGLTYDRVVSDNSKYSIAEFQDATFTTPASAVGNYFSYHIGVAGEYGLTEKLSIRISPRYESWMTPVFKNADLRTLPYSISLAAGLQYGF